MVSGLRRVGQDGGQVGDEKQIIRIVQPDKADQTGGVQSSGCHRGLCNPKGDMSVRVSLAQCF
jgi:hypothetical protein